MHGRLWGSEVHEEKNTAPSQPSWLFSQAKWLYEKSASLVLGDLWRASGNDGKGIGMLVAEAAKTAEDSPDHMAPPMRFANAKVHYIPAHFIEQLWLNQEKIGGQNPSGILGRVFGPDAIFSLPHSNPKRKPLRTNFLNRLFKDSALTNLMTPLQEIVAKYMAEIEKASGKIADVQSLCERFTMDVIGTTQLGFKKFDVKDQNKLSEIIDEMAKKIADPAYSLPSVVTKGVDLFNKYIYGKKTFDELMKSGRQIFDRLITDNVDNILDGDNWISQVSLRNILDPENTLTDEQWKAKLKSKSKDVMDALHSLAVKYDAALFLIVGHETSAKFLQYLFTRMIHPDNKTDLDDIRQELKKNPDQLTKEDIDKLEHLRAAGLEVLRLNPSVPTLNGRAEEEIVFFELKPEKGEDRKQCYLRMLNDPHRDKSKDVRIRAGDYFFISPLQVQHDKILYGENADKFDPKRFLGQKPDPNKFLPFGLPNQFCPGQKLAMLESFTLFLAICMKYDMQMTPDDLKRSQEVEPVFTLRPTFRVKAQGTLREEKREELRPK